MAAMLAGVHHGIANKLAPTPPSTGNAGEEADPEMPLRLWTALDRLEAFASFNGPDWYGLPRNTSQITLVRESWEVKASQEFADGDVLVPLRAGERVAWRIEPEKVE